MSVPSENDANQTVECPTCGQQASAETIAFIEQARAGEWSDRRRIEAAHSWRFRNLGGMLYPRQVARAYGGDIERAAAESDEQVAATVADWERSQGFEPVDWRGLGDQFRAFRQDDDSPFPC